MERCVQDIVISICIRCTSAQHPISHMAHPVFVVLVPVVRPNLTHTHTHTLPTLGARQKERSLENHRLFSYFLHATAATTTHTDIVRQHVGTTFHFSLVHGKEAKYEDHRHPLAWKIDEQMILHTVGYPAVKLCNFVCVCVCEGTSGGAQARSKVSKLARKFWVSFFNYTCLHYVPYQKYKRGGGGCFLCFALYVIGWWMNGLIKSIVGWLTDWLSNNPFILFKEKGKNNPKTKCEVAKCKQTLPTSKPN